MKSAVIYSLLASTASALVTPRAITGPTSSYECNPGDMDLIRFNAGYITRVITHAAKQKAEKDIVAAKIKQADDLQCVVSKTSRKKNQVCQPKEFKNYPTASGTFHFDNCPTGPWYEFPLMSGGDAVPMHTGPKNPGRQNPARVIFKYTDANTAKFCGVLTHSNLTQEGQFIACDEV